MKAVAGLFGLSLVVLKASAAAVAEDDGHGRAFRPRDTDETVSTDLSDYAPDPNTAFLSVSGTSTAWVPQDTNVISTVTVTTTSNGQVGTTMTGASIALYTGPSGDLNYLIAPALRDHIEEIGEALCGTPDAPIRIVKNESSKITKRDEFFCDYPKGNLQGSLFDSVQQQIQNEILNLLNGLGIGVPAAFEGQEMTVPKMAFMMTDNTIGSLRDDHRVPLSGKIPVDTSAQKNDGCPLTIPRCSACGGGNTGYCTGALYRCPCETSCPQHIEDEIPCKDASCDSKNGKSCSKEPYAGCPCKQDNDCPELQYGLLCSDPDCKSTDAATCSTQDYLQCPCKDSGWSVFDPTPNAQWIRDQAAIFDLINDDGSCPDNSFSNVSTIWHDTIPKLSNTGTITLKKTDHPEVFEPDAQWRFADLQGIMSEFSVYADGGASAPPTIIESDARHVTFEVAPNTQWIEVTMVLNETLPQCDVPVLLQSDGASSDGCGGKLPDLPDLTPPTGCPHEIPPLPDVTQDATFRVLFQRSTTGGTWYERLAMYGVDVNCPDIATRPDQYVMVMSFYTLEPGASLPPSLLQNSTAVLNYAEFTIEGGRNGAQQTNKPCGLDTQYYFQKKEGTSRFYWSDRGQETDAWQGYCDVPPQNKPWCLPNGSSDPYSYAVMLNCFAIDNPNYCTTYGSS